MLLKKHTKKKSKKDPKQLLKELFGPAHLTLPMIQCKNDPSFLPSHKKNTRKYVETMEPAPKKRRILSKAFPPGPSQVFCWLCVCVAKGQKM